MKLLISVAVAIVLMVGGLFYYFTGTPTYSLYQIKKAIQNHDSITFNKYVDVERIVDGLISEETQGIKEDGNNDLFAGLAQTLMDSLKTELKETLNKSIEDISSSAGGEYKELRIKEVEKEGKAADVTLGKDGGEPFKIKMIQTPDRYWRVVKVNLDDFKKVNPEVISEVSKTKESGDEEKLEQEVKFGEKVVIDSGWFITVQKPEVFTVPENSFFEPKSGNKIISVSIEYENQTNEGDQVNPENLSLRDQNNQVYEVSIWGGKEPELKDGAMVPAHDKARGYVNFEVPENAEIIKAIYSNSAATITITQ